MTTSLGELLREFRSSYGKIQNDIVAELNGIDASLDLDRSTISKWESDQVPGPTKSAKLVPPLATLLKKTSDEISKALVESRRRTNPLSELVVGNYELFQWSYANDGRIMKTNISVKENGKHGYDFTERVLWGKQHGTIVGRVDPAGKNLFFTGHGKKPFFECEAILIQLPRENEWTTGAVLGVTSDRDQHPSASPTVAKYLGRGEFGSEPEYGRLSKMSIPSKLKKFLSQPTSGRSPVISSYNAHDFSKD